MGVSGDEAVSCRWKRVVLAARSWLQGFELEVGSLNLLKKMGNQITTAIIEEEKDTNEAPDS